MHARESVCIANALVSRVPNESHEHGDELRDVVIRGRVWNRGGVVQFVPRAVPNTHTRDASVDAPVNVHHAVVRARAVVAPSMAPAAAALLRMARHRQVRAHAARHLAAQDRDQQ
jgi:hypothetical protein